MMLRHAVLMESATCQTTNVNALMDFQALIARHYLCAPMIVVMVVLMHHATIREHVTVDPATAFQDLKALSVRV